MTRIICHVYHSEYSEQKYFADIKTVTVTDDSPDLSDTVTEIAYSMLKSFTPQTGITIEEENILV